MKIKWRFPGYVWLISMLGSIGLISAMLLSHLLDFQLPPSAPAPPGIPSFTLAHATRRPTLVSGHYVNHYWWDALSPVKEAPFAYWTNGDRTTSATAFLLWSAGPDGRYDITIDNVAEVMSPRLPVPSSALINLTYDPSNGAWSRGDIYQYKKQ